MARSAGGWALALVGLLACGPGAVGNGTSIPDAVQREPPPAPLAGEYPPVQSTVPTFSLELSAADLERLQADPSSDVSFPCTVTLEGARATGRVRYRGASTRELPQKSYKIELDPGQELEDRDHFELLASWSDGGKLTEKFAVDLYRALGLPVPEAHYARVRVNGAPQGLYLDMEHVGKDWLKHHHFERDASIYRCGHRNCELTLKPGPYQGDFDKKTNEDTGREDLTAFLAFVNRSDDASFEAELERRVDVEAYLGNLAADMLVSNALIEDSRSFWVHALHADRWTYVPWDLNNARMLYWRTRSPEAAPEVGRWPQSFTLYDPAVQESFETRVTARPEQRPTWSVLATRVWDRPALRALVLAKLEAALAGPFSEERALAHVDALWKVVEPELAEDPYASAEHVKRARRFLEDYVRGRRAYLSQVMEILRAHGSGPLVIREVTTGGSGHVELYNRGPRELELGRYEVTSDLRATARFRLPAMTLGPGQAVRLLASGDTTRGTLHLPFTLSADGGEVGVFDGERRSELTGRPVLYGPEDAVWYGPLPAGTVYGRRGGGEGEDFERRPR